MFIEPVFAQAAGGASMLTNILPLVLIFVVFYFLLIRPQQKKVKQHKAMIDALRRGDRVITSGGLIGTVSKVIDEGEVEVTVAPEVKVRIIRSMIQDVRSKTEPVSDQSAASKAKNGKKGSKNKETEAANDSDSADSKS